MANKEPVQVTISKAELEAAFRGGERAGTKGRRVTLDADATKAGLIRKKLDISKPEKINEKRRDIPSYSGVGPLEGVAEDNKREEDRFSWRRAAGMKKRSPSPSRSDFEVKTGLKIRGRSPSPLRSGDSTPKSGFTSRLRGRSPSPKRSGGKDEGEGGKSGFGWKKPVSGRTDKPDLPKPPTKNASAPVLSSATSNKDLSYGLSPQPRNGPGIFGRKGSSSSDEEDISSSKRGMIC